MAHAAEVEKDLKKKSIVGDNRGRFRLMLFVTVALLALSAYSWLRRPALIWGPPVAPPPVVEREASLRMSMFLFGMRIDRLRATKTADGARGVYPATLEQLGDSLRGVTYTRLNDSTFELRGRVTGQEIVFRSDMRGQDFLGSAKEVIQSRRR